MAVRVLHVMPHRGGGAEAYIDMLERLPGFTHQRFYLSSGRKPVDAAASVPWRWPRLAAQVRGIDLIHCHGDVAGAIALPLLRRRPSVMTTHGLHLLRRARGPGHTLIVSATVAVVAGVRAVICTSASERDELGGLLGERELAKLRVIHNAIDPPPPIEESDRLAIRDHLGVGPEVVLGLFVGQLEPRKSPLLAAAAAQHVHAAGVPFVLAIAGDGAQSSQLRALAGDAVISLGHRSDVHRLLAASDVFVQPSEREGLSFALLEAMAHRRAVIAADAPGNREAIGDAGLLFGAGDEPALIDALTRLASDPELRAALGTKALARASERFGAEAFLAATAAVYAESLGSGRLAKPASARALER